ncbi:hypothetical protein Cni_G15809 [Canna indica]|uniref:Uncharacterized protein n=1 Tax=Canna indica TaxID=4628 RepID=A0AAQ3KHN7_9LILI|nr:hypothetical protein Cni_G15809 [Canna indica]
MEQQVRSVADSLSFLRLFVGWNPLLGDHMREIIQRIKQIPNMIPSFVQGGSEVFNASYSGSDWGDLRLQGVTGNPPLTVLQLVAPFEGGSDVHLGAQEVDSQSDIAKVELVKLYQDLAKAIAENSRFGSEVVLEVTTGFDVKLDSFSNRVMVVKSVVAALWVKTALGGSIQARRRA